MNDSTFPFPVQGNSSNPRQSGRLPNAIQQAKQPNLSTASTYEQSEGGMAISWAVILTALGVEHQAIEAHLKPFGDDPRLREESHSTSGTIYTQGQFKTVNGTWHVAIAQIDMGNASAALEATRAIEKFQPRVILFVGVAGGIKDVVIGDVVAAPIVYSYEVGKLSDDLTLPRPKLGEADYDLKQRAQREAGKPDWRSRIQPGRSEADQEPDVYIKPIAAGEKVIASRKSPVYEYLRQYYDDAIAVEMEGFGFLKATQQIKSVSAMVIRGISDLLDDKNDELKEPEAIRQERAARHASAFAFTLLEKLDGETRGDEGAIYEDEAQIDFDRALPEGFLSLNVQALSGEGEHYIHAHRGKQSFIEQGCIEPALLALHQQLSNIADAENLLGAIDHCNLLVKRAANCPARKLLAWLDEQKTDQGNCLLINEHTDTEIPWEFLEGAENPVGVAFQTVRQPQTSQEIQPETACCGGGVLMYANSSYGGWQQYQRQEFEVFPDFLSQVQTNVSEIGLVFIDGYSFEVPSPKNPTSFIKRSKLLKKRASIVFISGTVDFDVSIEITHTMLLTNFLEYGAKGVVGTLRQIDPARAKSVVEQFSEEHQQNPDWTVPEILRHLRSRAWAALEEEVNEHTSAIYLATFAHLYYGNPLAVLQLAPEINL